MTEMIRFPLIEPTQQKEQGALLLLLVGGVDKVWFWCMLSSASCGFHSSSDFNTSTLPKTQQMSNRNVCWREIVTATARTRCGVILDLNTNKYLSEKMLCWLCYFWRGISSQDQVLASWLFWAIWPTTEALLVLCCYVNKSTCVRPTCQLTHMQLWLIKSLCSH